MRKTYALLGVTLLLSLGLSNALAQHPASTSHYYVIGLNGSPVTVDGDIADWADAEFVYISQDMPGAAYLAQGGEDNLPLEGPSDFSAHVAMKFDYENMYFAVHARDEGGALIHERRTAETAAAMWQQDHFGVYLGLYDIGARATFHDSVVQILDANGEPAGFGGRTYRVGPGLDDDATNGTLGADYQLGVNVQDYDTILDNGAFYATGDDVITYNYGYVDGAISDTEVAISLWPDENGYTLEWRVPFASVAGFLRGDTLAVEWPLYRPKHGDVVPFDFDVTDEDRPGMTANNFLRYGEYGALWRDSFGMSGRGIVRDISGGRTAGNWVHAMYTPEGAEVEVDGDLSDWSDVQFVGQSQDSPGSAYLPQGGEDNLPLEGPSDFGGHLAFRADDDYMYFAGHIRDEGGALIHERRTAETAAAMWQQDHFGVYIGLFNIGDLRDSPHDSIVQILTASGDPAGFGGRTYRVGPGLDDDSTFSTLGADYQIATNIQDYDTILDNGSFYASGDEVVTYNYGYVDHGVANTEVAISLWPDENGYSFEWKVPFASMAGYQRGDTLDVKWPLYKPFAGDVVPIDWDITDEDRPGMTANNFLRKGTYGALWRDSFGMGMRMRMIDPIKGIVTALDRDPDTFQTIIPEEFQLFQNYPNPFNPMTTIQFDLAQQTEASLKIYNLVGQEVATLVERQVAPAGRYSVTWDARSVPSGIYIYVLRTPDNVETRKMTLIK